MRQLSNTMRAIIIASAVLFGVESTAFAAVPHWINYQGYLAYPEGTPMDTTVSITFRLYPEYWSVDPVWDEMHDVTVVDGIYSTMLGSADALPQSFFDDGSMWLGVQVGTDTEMTPRIDLAAVPYAYRIGTVDEATGGTIWGQLNVGAENTNSGEMSNVFGFDCNVDGDYSAAFGRNNSASGQYSFAAGRDNVASFGYTTVAGGIQNKATDLAATVSGGANNNARGQFSVIAGGGGPDSPDSNSAQGSYSAIGGGYHNYATGDASTIAGGYWHIASQTSATIGGGYRNTATNFYSTVGGGTNNDATGQYSTIGGGRYNGVFGNRSTVAGGSQNIIATGAEYSVIAGGADNNVSGDYSASLSGKAHQVSGQGSVICGGGRVGVNDSLPNIITSDLGFIGGGSCNQIETSLGAVISGGYHNSISSAARSTIGGGNHNSVSGYASTIPGGSSNTVSGSSSFACGMSANVSADSAFVFGDGTETFGIGMNKTANFLVTRGMRVWTANPVSANIGVRVVGGGTSWISLCDSSSKTNRTQVNGDDVLNKLASMPIDRWNYKHQPDGPAHIGPMAQDFWSAFHLGTDSLGIETLDADGVLFAAVKELISRNEELETRVRALEAAVLQYGNNESRNLK